MAQRYSRLPVELTYTRREDGLPRGPRPIRQADIQIGTQWVASKTPTSIGHLRVPLRGQDNRANK